VAPHLLPGYQRRVPPSQNPMQSTIGGPADQSIAYGSCTAGALGEMSSNGGCIDGSLEVVDEEMHIGHASESQQGLEVIISYGESCKREHYGVGKYACRSGGVWDACSSRSMHAIVGRRVLIDCVSILSAMSTLRRCRAPSMSIVLGPMMTSVLVPVAVTSTSNLVMGPTIY